MGVAATDFLVIGHRGSPRRARENSLQSFRMAIAEGADGFETDLRRLRDGSAIVFHDDELDGEPIEGKAFSEVERVIASPTRLQDLAEFRESTMILEVKRSGWERELATVVQSWRGVIISSFDHRVIGRLRDLRLPQSLGLIVQCRLVDAELYAENMGAGWYFPHVRYVDRELVESLHRKQVRVVPWTANDRQSWQALRALGCDGVITDLPEEAVQWRNQLC